MLPARNPLLPLHQVPDLSELQFKPESIVAYLAALGDECTAREEQMLARFLSACRMRSFLDQSLRSVATLQEVIDRHGPWIAVFSTPEAQAHAHERAQLENRPWAPTVVSIADLLEKARYSSAGVALDPFSAHVRTIPWETLRHEHEEFRRASEWTPPLPLSEQPMLPCIWDSALSDNLHRWLINQHGVAQVVVAVMGASPERARLTVVLDCVPSVQEQCKNELRQLLLFGDHALPVEQGIIQVHVCDDEAILDRLVQRGALSLRRDAALR